MNKDNIDMIWFVNTNLQYSFTTIPGTHHPRQPALPFRPISTGHFASGKHWPEATNQTQKIPEAEAQRFEKSCFNPPFGRSDRFLGWKKTSVLGVTTPAWAPAFLGGIDHFDLFFLPFGHYFFDDWEGVGRWVGWPNLRIQTHHTTHQQSSYCKL